MPAPAAADQGRSPVPHTIPNSCRRFRFPELERGHSHCLNRRIKYIRFTPELLNRSQAPVPSAERNRRRFV